MKPQISATARRLSFPARQRVVIESHKLAPPAPGEVRVRFELSLMSTGTENIVFNRLFAPGTHWDRWVKYPFYPGYLAVGTVEGIGRGVKEHRVGDRVACRTSHRSAANLPAGECYPVPDGLSSEEAAWFGLAKIAFVGARAADYRLGDSVLVVGAGPIGQMSVRWARAAGAETVIVADPVESRLALAAAGGATATISAPVAEAGELVRKANLGHAPRVVIDSTGNAKVFEAALGLVAKFGTVVVLGDTGFPGQQALTSDVIGRGLRIVGAHDVHETPEWNNASITRLFFSLALAGRFPLAGLTSHRFAPDDCAEAYGLANRDRASTMGILFDWAKPGKKKRSG